MSTYENLKKTNKGLPNSTTIGWTILSIAIVVMAGFAIGTPIVIAIRSTPSNTTSTSTSTSGYFNTATTYGSLYFTASDDGDMGYVLINSVDVVNQTSGTVTSSYVEQITFSFIVAPSTSTPGIWLYVMNRNGSGAIFYPTVIYQLPYSLITVGAAGIQTMTLSSSALPISQGQYVGVGFASGSGGSCYRVSNRNEYYIGTSTFSTLTSTTYTSSPGAGFAFTFVVRTIGYTSG